MSETQQRRFGGMDRLYGVDGAKAIRSSHVVVVGIGGVGSWAVEALARSGVGRLTLIDLDHVAESNVNRQIHALESTLGMAKVQAMRERIGQINAACEVHCIEEFVDPDNWQTLLDQMPYAVDAVIDACDQMKAKVTLAAWALRQRKIFISVGAAGGKRLAHAVEIEDLAHTTHDPLLSQLRYRLRRTHGAARDGKKMGVTCVYSKESVTPPDASCDIQKDGTLNCSGYGSLVSVTASFGFSAAGWVMNKISSKFLAKTEK
jgi:tRNA A37 threonylcarbamoyladenosine dehydratase